MEDETCEVSISTLDEIQDRIERVRATLPLEDYRRNLLNLSIGTINDIKKSA